MKKKTTTPDYHFYVLLGGFKHVYLLKDIEMFDTFQSEIVPST